MPRSGLRTLLGAVALLMATLAVAPAAVAETIIFTAELLPENVIPLPTVPPGTNPLGLAVIKLTLVRDFANHITAASFDYDIGLVGFGSGEVVTGVEIGGAPLGYIEEVLSESGITPGSGVPLVDGKAFFTRVDPDIPCVCAVEYVLFVPSDFFVRVKTASNPSGALRGQLRAGTFQGVGAGVVTNQRSYAGGDLFRLAALIGNLGSAVDVQIFAGLILSAELSAAACPGPGNRALIFFGPGGTSAQECLGSLSSTPLAFTTLPLPAGGVVQEIPIVEFTMPSGLPTGTSQGFMCYANPQGQTPQAVCDTTAFVTNP